MIGAATIAGASVRSDKDILKGRRQKSITLFCCTAAITPEGMATITAIATAMSASWALTSSIAPWRRAAIGRTRPFAPLRQPWSQPLPGESRLYVAVRAGCPVLVDRDPAEIIAHAFGLVIRLRREGEGLVAGELLLLLQNRLCLRTSGVPVPVIRRTPARHRAAGGLVQGPATARENQKSSGPVTVLQNLDAPLAVNAHGDGLAHSHVVEGNVAGVQPQGVVAMGGANHRLNLVMPDIGIVLAPVANPVPVGLQRTSQGNGAVPLPNWATFCPK